MKLIAKPRGTGKTTELLLNAHRCNGYLVVQSRNRAYQVAQMAKEMDLHINFPLSFDEFTKGQFHGRNCAPLWIDDVDLLVEHLARGTSIGAVTISGEGMSHEKLNRKAKAMSLVLLEASGAFSDMEDEYEKVLDERNWLRAELERSK